MYSLTDIHTTQFCNTPEEKYFAPWKILYVFIISFVNLFVDISSTFSNKPSSSLSTNTCLALSEVTFLLIFFSLSSKSVSFAKSAISSLVTNFACASQSYLPSTY